jgi:two-component system phosphate regulon sensor histidine kinase PhoR
MSGGESRGLIGRVRAAWLGLGGIETPRPPEDVPETTPRVLENLIAVLPIPAIILDDKGRVLTFNLAAIDIAPVLQQGISFLIALRVPELIEAVRRAEATGLSQRVKIEQRVPRERYFEVFLNPVSFPRDKTEERLEALLITFNDLTPLHRVEQMRADFVANASHELRTPLAALLGFIETLQGPARNDVPMREKFLGIMREQAARMARLIDDLLSLSRIELNAHLRPAAEVELTAIIRQVVDSLQMLARERGVEIHIDAGEAIAILGERDELVRAFENLVENAIKYGGDGKRIDITVARVVTASGEHEARVVVRDYGPGIAPEHLPRLTERFYRVNATTSRAQGGTGLGLALVKHILNRHGGKLVIESVLGQGATFVANLPVHRPKSV